MHRFSTLTLLTLLFTLACVCAQEHTQEHPTGRLTARRRRKLRVGRNEHLDQKGMKELNSLGMGDALTRVMRMNAMKHKNMTDMTALALKNLSPEEKKARLERIAAVRKAHKEKMEKRRQAELDKASLWFWQRWWKAIFG